jgi:prephenate dehydrogenase
MKPPGKVVIVGLGVIGGSLARDLAAMGCVVTGVDTRSVRRRARAAGALSASVADVERALGRAELVVLAASPRANLALLRRLARVAPPGLVITDVGSVKSPICREARRLGMRGFVGGHPMAGNERSGFAASQRGLFRRRTWILVPTSNAARPLAAVRRLVRAVGGRPVEMSAAAHDRVVAFLSHAPQVLAWALFAATRHDALAAERLALAGPAFDGIARLAASPRPLWREILEQNRHEVARALGAVTRALRGASKAAAFGDKLRPS